MSWPIFWAFVLGLAALAAVVLFVAVFLNRRTLPSWVGDWWVKIIAEFVSFGSAGLGLWATYTVVAENRSVWICPALTGGLSVVLWKALQHFVEWLIKRADRADRKLVGLLKAESRFRADILSGSRDHTLKVWEAVSGTCLWTGTLLPEGQTASIDERTQRVMSASPEAWRWLAWLVTDPQTGKVRRLPIAAGEPIGVVAQVSNLSNHALGSLRLET